MSDGYKTNLAHVGATRLCRVSSRTRPSRRSGSLRDFVAADQREHSNRSKKTSQQIKEDGSGCKILLSELRFVPSANVSALAAHRQRILDQATRHVHLRWRVLSLRPPGRLWLRSLSDVTKSCLSERS